MSSSSSLTCKKSSSSVCMTCGILQQSLKELQSELQDAKRELATYTSRQGAGSSRHAQQLVEAPRELDLLRNLEHYHRQQQQQQQQQEQLMRVVNRRFEAARTSGQHPQKQQQLMDIWRCNERFDGAGPSVQPYKQVYEAPQQLMDIWKCNQRFEGQQQLMDKWKCNERFEGQQQLMDIWRCNERFDGAGPSGQVSHSGFTKLAGGPGAMLQQQQQLTQLLQMMPRQQNQRQHDN